MIAIKFLGNFFLWSFESGKCKTFHDLDITKVLITGRWCVLVHGVRAEHAFGVMVHRWFHGGIPRNYALPVLPIDLGYRVPAYVIYFRFRFRLSSLEPEWQAMKHWQLVLYFIARAQPLYQAGSGAPCKSPNNVFLPDVCICSPALWSRMG